MEGTEGRGIPLAPPMVGSSPPNTLYSGTSFVLVNYAENSSRRIMMKNAAGRVPSFRAICPCHAITIHCLLDDYTSVLFGSPE